MTMQPKQILLTGATGFVGRHLYPELYSAGHRIVCGSRRPDQARKRYPEREFRKLDVEEEGSIRDAMRGCDVAVYLIHAMAQGRGYEEVERRSAESFRRAAEKEGLARIVYLGGLRPRGVPSRHLRSRLITGEILRTGSVPTLELQATMIVGNGSESWRIVRDLAARLPVMILPKWLESRSQPIGIDDVTFAITKAVSLDMDASTAYPLPGTEVLTGKQILQRTARLLGSDPKMVGIPVITPTLSSYWIRLITRADRRIADELVQGLRSDIVADVAGFWEHFPEHPRLSFDEAARRAIHAEDRELPWKTRAAESLLRRIGSMRLKAGRARAISG